jgi:NitT/TauT family transport system ATP-binding protein
MSNPIIRLEDVDVDYPVPGQPVRRVLSGIDLKIESGEFTSIVGQTGCGKSTLLRLILGEQMPSRGGVLVNGRERSQPDRLCGYVPQKYSLFPDKTVLDNVTFGLDVTEFGAFSVIRPERRKRVREFRATALRYLEQMGLDESDAHKYPHQLSGGMQQRVAIAQALVLQPPILLMDEAFSALDPVTRTGMQRLIKELWSQSGTTIVFVTHNTREAVCLGTRVIALARPAWDRRGSSEPGASAALDVSVPHLDFDSDEVEVKLLIQQIESATLEAFPQSPYVGVLRT